MQLDHRKTRDSTRSKSIARTETIERKERKKASQVFGQRGRKISSHQQHNHIHSSSPRIFRFPQEKHEQGISCPACYSTTPKTQRVKEKWGGIQAKKSVTLVPIATSVSSETNNKTEREHSPCLLSSQRQLCHLIVLRPGIPFKLLKTWGSHGA